MVNVTDCVNGLYDCDYDGIPSGASSCAPYDETYHDMEGVVWPVVVAGIIMCMMAFGIGSNDAANSWATSVGSGAITLKTALILGAVCEFSGTVLLGSGVAKTIKEDISDIEHDECWSCGYCDSKMSMFQAGMLASLLSTAVFLLLSSVTSMPVSATHAVVGSVAGMTIGAVGVTCVDWSFSGMGSLMASWVISPLLAGIIAVFVLVMTKRNILEHPNPRKRVLRTIPFFVVFITMVMTFLVCVKSEDLKHLGIVIQLIITGVAGIVTCIASYVFLLPWIRRNLPTVRHPHHFTADMLAVNAATSHENFKGGIMLSEIDTNHDDDGDNYSDKSSLKNSTAVSEDGSLGSLDHIDADDDSIDHDMDSKPPATETDDALFCFRVLLVFNAALKSFAHGANDTANATGPFGAVLEIQQHGFDICSDNNRRSPIWILVLAGTFVAIGIMTFGHKMGSCVSVVLATQLGIPVSTTHCQIGAVVGAGLLTQSEEKKVRWGLIGKIALTWIITVPFSGLLSVALMEALLPAFRN